MRRKRKLVGVGRLSVIASSLLADKLYAFLFATFSPREFKVKMSATRFSTFRRKKYLWPIGRPRFSTMISVGLPASL